MDDKLASDERYKWDYESYCDLMNTKVWLLDFLMYKEDLYERSRSCNIKLRPVQRRREKLPHKRERTGFLTVSIEERREASSQWSGQKLSRSLQGEDKTARPLRIILRFYMKKYMELSM